MSCKIIYTYKQYMVLDTGKDLVIKNTHGKYKNHSHFYRKADKDGRVNLNTVKTCIRLADNKKIPKSSYMLVAAQRLTTDKKFKDTLERIKNKRAQKKKYFNPNKGLKICRM